MRKDDIQTSYHQGHHGCPMLNVKLHDVSREAIEEHARTLDDAPPLFLEWLRCECTDHDVFCASEWVREDQWEHATQLAEEAFDIRFGPRVKVYSAGRCGGWLVVEGLPDVEEWDAIAVSRWARFARNVEAIRSDHAYLVADSLRCNVWLAPEVRAIG